MSTASWFHCSMKPISRSAGRSVVAAAAYRLGECLHDEVHAVTHDYTRRRGVEATFTVTPIDAPEWAKHPESLWNAAEAAETRKNSTVGREVELALPSFLPAEDRQAIAQRFAETLVDRYKVAVSVAIHEPSRHGDDRNYHAHVLFTTREMDADGLGKKTRILDDRKTGPQEVLKLRELAAAYINDALAAAHSDIRVDHRSFKERGIDQEPTTHLGPAASEMERRGEESERGSINREILDKRELAALDAAIVQEETRLASPAESAQDAKERLQDDRQLYDAAQSAASKVEEDLPADRMSWGERLLLFVARSAKSMFDSIAEKALELVRFPNSRATGKDRQWRAQEHTRRQTEREREIDL